MTYKTLIQSNQGPIVEVYDASQEPERLVPEGDPEPWAAVCQEHAEATFYEHRSEAIRAARNPVFWCPCCKTKSQAQADMPHEHLFRMIALQLEDEEPSAERRQHLLGMIRQFGQEYARLMVPDCTEDDLQKLHREQMAGSITAQEREAQADVVLCAYAFVHRKRLHPTSAHRGVEGFHLQDIVARATRGCREGGENG